MLAPRYGMTQDECLFDEKAHFFPWANNKDVWRSYLLRTMADRKLNLLSSRMRKGSVLNACMHDERKCDRVKDLISCVFQLPE